MFRIKEEVVVLISDLWWITTSSMRQAAGEKGRATRSSQGSLEIKGFLDEGEEGGEGELDKGLQGCLLDIGRSASGFIYGIES